MAKCFFCDKKFNNENVIIGSDGFAHCPLCGQPIFDVSLQSTKHWIWKVMSEKLKKKFGYYYKLEREKTNEQ